MGEGPVLYAIATERQPKPASAAAGCPASGWVHEGAPPWRVLTSEDPFRLPPGLGAVLPYSGEEQTLDWETYVEAHSSRRALP